MPTDPCAIDNSSPQCGGGSSKKKKPVQQGCKSCDTPQPKKPQPKKLKKIKKGGCSCE